MNQFIIPPRSDTINAISLALLDPAHGENHPFCDIDGVISDALQVLVDHQKIKDVFSLVRLVNHLLDQHSLNLSKITVNDVVMGNNQLSRSEERRVGKECL